MIVGITGGTGCGKTTALSAFAALGGRVLDCDRIYHELLRQDAQMIAAIDSRFPGTVKEGILNTKALGAIVFGDESALKDLNAITHGAVKKRVQQLLSEADGPAAIDAIALFEGGLAELCQVTVAVIAPESSRVARLMARDGISREYAQMRIRAQKPQEAFSEMCGYTLCNDGTQEEFYGKCLAFFRNLGIMKP